MPGERKQSELVVSISGQIDLSLANAVCFAHKVRESCMFGVMSGIWKRKTRAFSQTPVTERAG